MLTITQEQADLRVQAARACRVLAHQGLVDDVLGHVSVRIDAQHLLIRCRGPRERGLLFTSPEDIRLLDLDGGGSLDGDYSAPNELPLHTETLRQRPEIEAIVHAHPPSTVTADLAGVTLRPIVGAFNIPAMRLALDGIPVYPRAVLIRRPDLAAEMLSIMQTSPVCLLRGHGLTATGESIPQAVVRALNVDKLARVCLEIARCGSKPRDLPSEDIAELPDLGTSFNDALVWRHLVAQLQQDGLDVQ